MKKASFLLALFVLTISITSCNKEKQLGNRLQDKWDVESVDQSFKTTLHYYGSDDVLDSSVVQTNNSNTTYKITTTGTVDFISDDKLVIDFKIVTVATTTNSGSSGFEIAFTEEESSVTTTSVTTEEESTVTYNYYSTGADEVTLIDYDGDVTVYNVTTNKKKEQVWESVITEKDTDYEDDGSYVVTEEVSTFILSIKKQ